MMGKLVMVAIGCLMLAAAPLAMGQSTPPKKPGTTAQQKQQERQNACNVRANDKGLSGQERKNYITACLKGDPADPASK